MFRRGVSEQICCVVAMIAYTSLFVDTGMLTKNVDAVHGGTSQQYAIDLIAEIKASVLSGLPATTI